MMTLTRDAQTELLKTLESVCNLLYVVQHGSRESTRYLAEMKRELERAATLVVRMQAC